MGSPTVVSKSQKKKAKQRAKKLATEERKQDTEARCNTDKNGFSTPIERDGRPLSSQTMETLNTTVLDNPWAGSEEATNSPSSSANDTAPGGDRTRKVSHARHDSEDLGNDYQDHIDYKSLEALVEEKFYRRQDGSGVLSVHASHLLLKGQRVLCEKPLHVWHHQSPIPTPELMDQLECLSDKAFNVFNSRDDLWTSRPSTSELKRADGTDKSQLPVRAHVEGLLTTGLDRSEPGLHAIWQMHRRFIEQTPGYGSILGMRLSRYRHSCQPNAEYHWNEELNQVTIHTTRAVNAGDEITIAYLAPSILADANPKRQLQQYFGIECQMPCCQLRPISNRGYTKPAPEGLQTSILNGRYHQLNLAERGLIRTLSDCITYCKKQHLLSTAVPYYIVRGRQYAISRKAIRALDDFQEARDLVVDTHGSEHPYARKLQVMTNLLAEKQNDPARFIAILYQFSSPKRLVPLAGAPTDILDSLKELHKKWNAEASLTTYENVLQTPRQPSLPTRSVLNRKWTSFGLPR
ncbi:SET domain-containing protein 5 [Elsinoe fawcettii]|nr:SET domain-containing protein 5 [Elsinoe fawcettii]